MRYVLAQMAVLPTMLLVLSFIISFSLPVSAQEKSKEDAKKLAEENKKKVEAEIEKATPITEWISSENALLKRLAEPNQQTFFIFRNKHSVIRVVETVRRDVGNAVKACGTENKEMADPMNTRFKNWENAVTSILKDAEKFLALELKEQEAFHISDYKHIMKLNDKAYAFSDAQVQKTPVTTVEACQGLLDSMDRTEESLVNLLQDVLLPEEVIKERVEQANKVKARKEEEKKEEKK